MSLGERVWDTLTAVTQVKDKIAGLTDAMKSQQARVEDLTGRMIRLETAMAMLMRREGGSLYLPAKGD